MKRMYVFLFAALFGLATFAETPSQFLDRYENLVERVEDLDSDDIDQEELDKLKKEYNDLTKEFNGVKSKMNNDEVEKYYRYKARYQKKIATISAKRTSSKVKGWVKGIFNK